MRVLFLVYCIYLFVCVRVSTHTHVCTWVQLHSWALVGMWRSDLWELAHSSHRLGSVPHTRWQVPLPTGHSQAGPWVEVLFFDGFLTCRLLGGDRKIGCLGEGSRFMLLCLLGTIPCPRPSLALHQALSTMMFCLSHYKPRNNRAKPSQTKTVNRNNWFFPQVNFYRYSATTMGN